MEVDTASGEKDVASKAAATSGAKCPAAPKPIAVASGLPQSKDELESLITAIHATVNNSVLPRLNKCLTAKVRHTHTHTHTLLLLYSCLQFSANILCVCVCVRCLGKERRRAQGSEVEGRERRRGSEDTDSLRHGESDADSASTYHGGQPARVCRHVYVCVSMHAKDKICVKERKVLFTKNFAGTWLSF